MASERGGTPHSPISLAVVVSLLSVLLVLFFSAAIFLNYVLTVHYVHELQAQQAKQGIPVCRVLKGVAEARNGAVFWEQNNPRTYENRLAPELTRLYVITGCEHMTGPL